MKILQIFSIPAKVSGFLTILQVIMATPSAYSADSDSSIETFVATSIATSAQSYNTAVLSICTAIEASVAVVVVSVAEWLGFFLL